MTFCPYCGAALPEGTRHCPICGRERPRHPLASFPWRRLAMLLLGIFIVLAAGQIVYDRVRPAVLAQAPDLGDLERIAGGDVTGLTRVGSWAYPGGTMVEYQGRDSQGYALTVYKDLATGAVRSFTVALPPATRVVLSQEQAQRIAEAVASRASFFSDPTLALREASLVDHGEGSDAFYAFRWTAVDPVTGAVLLREIQVLVHPETGGVAVYLTRDGGQVTIPTSPAITRDQAVALAKAAIGDEAGHPLEVEEQILQVIVEAGSPGGRQRLVWRVILCRDPGAEFPVTLRVTLDAQSGEVLGVDS
ncbi:MAG: PepSY domain-containing protein [Bacillota bacterium]